MGCRPFTPLHRPLDYGLLSCIGRISMDHVATFVKKPTNVDKVRLELYTEILKADRTAMSLMEQGFARSHVQHCMPILIAHGLIYKYGSGKKTYYSVNKYEESVSKAVRKKADPIVLPAGIKGGTALAFRMGYTDIEPVGGRLYKGALSVEP